jgi:Short-chain dehydrogenases of various substrate specificities
VSVETFELEILDFESHQGFLEKLPAPISGVVLCVGYLGYQNDAIGDASEAFKILNTNFLGPINFLNEVANYFEKRKTGFIVVISSVAGDRGRASNYFYGAAKSGLTTYLSGIRNRLFKSGVHVLTVKPGFVDTKMTRKLELPKGLTSEPIEAAEIIYRAIKNKKDVIYVKGRWRFIMLIVRLLPEGIFKRLNL